MSKKTYMLNGKMVDEYGDVVKTNKTESLINKNNKESNKTGASLATRIIAIALVASSLAMYTIASKTEDYSAKYDENKPVYEEIVEERVVVTTEYQFLYTDTGEKYIIHDDTIKLNLDNCSACKVGGIYYSRTEDELVVLKVTQNYTETVELTQQTRYVAPEGYVVVGNKCYKEEYVIDAVSQTNSDGTKTYYAPEGYILYGNKAVKAEFFNEAIRPEEETTYSAPTGYVIEGNKAVKTIQYSTEYLLTKEQYESEEYDHLIQKKGEYVNHTVFIVKAEPMSDLYEQLGIEYEHSQKLTK